MITGALLVWWAIVGWCGTVPRPRFPFPGPTPPDPQPWRTVALGIVGGVVGGALFALAFGEANVQTGLLASNAIVSGIGALAGSLVVQDAFNRIGSMGKQTG